MKAQYWMETFQGGAGKPKKCLGEMDGCIPRSGESTQDNRSSERGGDERRCIWECPRYTGRLECVVDLVMPKIHRYSTVEVREVELNEWCTWEAQSTQEVRSMRGWKRVVYLGSPKYTTVKRGGESMREDNQVTIKSQQ
jgi:hypothetical protein